MNGKKRDAKRRSRAGGSSFTRLPVAAAFAVRGQASRKTIKGATDSEVPETLQTTEPTPPPTIPSLAFSTQSKTNRKEIVRSQRDGQESPSQPGSTEKKRWVDSHGASEWDTEEEVDDAIKKDLRGSEDEPISLLWDQKDSDRHLGTVASACGRWKAERVLDRDRGKWNVFLDKVNDSDGVLGDSYSHDRSRISTPGAFRSMSNIPNSRVDCLLDSEEADQLTSSSISRVVLPNQTMNEILVEASLVASAEFQMSDAPSLPTYVTNAPFVEATPLTQGNKKQILCVGAGLVFVVALLLGLSLGLSMRPSRDGNASSQAPSAAPTTELTGDFYDSLPSDTRTAVNDPTSPQCQAFRWVTNSTDPPSTLQRLALATIFYSTRGPQWSPIDEKRKQWLTENHECEWYGVECDGSNGSVKGLTLQGNRLSGPLPREIGLLAPSLQRLELASNSLTAQVPSTIGDLVALTLLDLAINFLTGSMPSEIGQLQQLTQLSLYKNNLSDTIPAEYYDLASLELLQLYENPLTGSLATEIGRLTKLTALNLAKNLLRGSIPTELGLLTNLVFLNLSGMKLSGSVPTEIGLLNRLAQCSLRDTQLNHSIPTEIGHATNLEKLFLYANQLSGEIPSQIALLSKLTDLEIDTNHLRGTIPTELGRLTNLNYLTMYNNVLEGPIPSEFGGLSHVKHLELFGNRLSQTIPSEVAQLTSLEVLLLYDNLLTGTLPAVFASGMKELLIYRNHLSGTVSSVLCDLIEANPMNLTLDCGAIVCQCGCSCVNDT